MSTLIHQRVELCRRGEYEKQICRVESGWVVLGDVQFLRGYSLILPDPVVADVNQLSLEDRATLFRDVTCLGDTLLKLTNAIRINYEILGNLEPALHVHLFPRFDDEPQALRTKPVWFYDWESSPPFDLERDRSLMQAIREELVEAGVAKTT